MASPNKAPLILSRPEGPSRRAHHDLPMPVTEEQIRAEAAAESRALVDLFIDIVKKEIADEDLRDRIARAILERLPTEMTEDAEDGAA